MQPDSAPDLSFDLPAMHDLATVRALIRRGAWRWHTSGLVPDRVQANVVILPAQLADDFRAFCHLNPRACPLLAESKPGDPHLPALGAALDVRSDVPRYQVYRNGKLVAEPTDIHPLYRDDLVAFAIGCSFTFEQALLREGIALRHVTARRNVAMYRTDVPSAPAGRFAGPLVVSMRPIPRTQVERVIAVTARFARVHGAPIHIGHPAGLGIAELTRPDFGDAVAVLAGELPVFWACGVTATVAVRAARPSLAITHAPGAMLITDLTSDQLTGGA
jgi:uncharacterized protein YcsI (UPF0317 family)